MVLGVTGCGEQGDGGGGAPGGGGAAGTVGAAGGGGSGAAGGGDCARICGSPCVGEYLPPGALDDCELSCAMGFFTCIPELIDALDCIEGYSCVGTEPSCIAQTAALTTCLSSP